MSYIKQILMDDEKVVYELKPHWIIYSNTAIWLIASFLLYIFGKNIGPNMIMFGYPIHKLASFILFVMAIYSGISAYIYFYSSEFAITNRRLIMKTGFIQRRSTEILFQKVESVEIEQTITGRIFSYGTIIIKGVGGTKDPFPNIPEPLKFREIVQQQSEQETQK